MNIIIYATEKRTWKEERTREEKRQICEKENSEKVIAFCFTSKMNGGPSGFSTSILPPNPIFICLFIFLFQLNFSISFFLTKVVLFFRILIHIHIQLLVATANAPVTRAFIIASALFTIFFGIQGRFSTLGLSYQVPFLLFF